MKKILIFNPFGIGDVLFTTPLIRNLKENIQGVSIFYISNRRTYPLLKNNVFLDKVFIFEKDEWKACMRESKTKLIRKFWSFFRDIRGENFDVVFDLSLNVQYGFFFKLAGINKRMGYNFKKRGRFLTHKIDIPYGYKDKHVVRYYLDLLKFLDISFREYKFDLFFAEDNNIGKINQTIFEDYGKEDTLLIGVCPGSGDSWQDTAYFKRWPKDYFLKLCCYLIQEKKAKIVLLGSESEADLCKYLFMNLGEKALNLCGKLSLEEAVEVISKCNLIIANDGGLFHIAQSLNKKVIGFFGPADDKVYGAYPQGNQAIVLKKDIECRPCYREFRFKGCSFDKRCLKEITVEEVCRLIEEIIP